MNPPPDDRDRPIAGASGEDWDLHALPAIAARTARRAHRIRQGVRAGSTIGLIALGAVVAWKLRPTETPPLAQTPVAKPAPAYEIISDEQLRQELATQSVMITQKDGRIDGVIWLDQ